METKNERLDELKLHLPKEECKRLLIAFMDDDARKSKQTNKFAGAILATSKTWDKLAMKLTWADSGPPVKGKFAGFGLCFPKN